MGGGVKGLFLFIWAAILGASIIDPLVRISPLKGLPVQEINLKSVVYIEIVWLTVTELKYLEKQASRCNCTRMLPISSNTYTCSS